MKIDDLIVTQNGVRNLDRMRDMVQFVCRGGVFTRDVLLAHAIWDKRGREGPPITIARVGSELYLHDGHHRVGAIWWGSRKVLHESEYRLVEFSYADYSDVNFDAGWYTPFDLDTECRRAEFGGFKATIKGLVDLGKDNIASIFVDVCRDLYVEPRRITRVSELVESQIKIR